MEKEAYLKKFFMDIYQDPGMYLDYICGRINIDSAAFSKWYYSIERRNREFLYSISTCKCINFRSFIKETALSENLTVTTPIYKNRTIEISEMAMPKIEMLKPGFENYHYICNGCYETTLQNIYNVLSNGSFTVGICCDKKTDEYRDLVKYYNILKDFLMRKGYIATSYEANVSGKNKMYLLMYDSKKQNKKISR